VLLLVISYYSLHFIRSFCSMFSLMSKDDKYLTCDHDNVFECRNGDCLNEKYRCDGKNECFIYRRTGEDELGCGKN
jgi:hypothetical protein